MAAVDAGQLLVLSVATQLERLTVITLVMAIPTIVFSFYGMNVDDLPGVFTWWIPFAVSVVACIAVGLIMRLSKVLR